jgi:serine/threonine-protein kinase RsbT
MGMTGSDRTAQSGLVPEARRVTIHSELDIVAARVEGRSLAKEIGFGIIDQARIATAVSELARNVVLYAEHGEITLKQVSVGEKIGMEILCEDRGRGIEDIEQVWHDEDSTAAQVGVELSGTKRLMDHFEIKSRVGVGTTITVRKWLS